VERVAEDELVAERRDVDGVERADAPPGRKRDERRRRDRPVSGEEPPRPGGSIACGYVELQSLLIQTHGVKRMRRRSAECLRAGPEPAAPKRVAEEAAGVSYFSVASPLTLPAPIETRTGFVSFGFGIRTSSTPASKSATTFCGSIPSGRVSEREKLPKLRSTR